MMQRKLATLILFLILSGYAGIAQSSNIAIDSNLLKAKATAMAESFLKGDYKTFVKFTYPKVIQMMGGEDKMIAVLKQGIEQLEGQGFAVKSVHVGLTSQAAMAGTEIHTLVLQSLIMSAPGGTLTSNSYLLAISQDGGKNWYFVDTAPLHDERTLKAIFPNYNKQLELPEKQPPVFVKD